MMSAVMIPPVSSLILLGGITAASFPPAQQNAHSFAGVWERDPDESDDAQAKMRAAFERMREQMERRAGPGGAPPPAPQGGRGRAGAPASPGSVADELQIELDSSELRVDDGERLQIYYLDGKKHRRELPNGAKLETVSLLQGNTVVVDEKLERGKINRKFELAEGGRKMVVTLTVKLGNMKEPVVIRTVYNRVDESDPETRPRPSQA
jgi:hypothetical protein